MPYKRSFGKRLRRSTSTYRKSATVYKPRVSPYGNRQLSLEKAGVDTISKLITAPIYGNVVGINNFVFTNSADAQLAFNPLNYLYESCSTFNTHKSLYKEYRMKQCKIHVMLQRLSPVPLAQWTQGQPLHVAYAWKRSAEYGPGIPVAYSYITVLPNCVQKAWTTQESKVEFWTSITAANTSGENNWLNTAYNPNTTPNLGMKFMPEFIFNTELGNVAASGDILYTYEVEYLIEFRGSLM